MRVLLIVDCYLPSTKSVAQLTHDLASEFVEQGHDTTILAPSDSQKEGLTVFDDGLFHVVRYRTNSTKGAKLALRAVNELSLSGVALWQTRHYFADREYDSIVFYAPSIFFGPLVRQLKKRWNCPSYLILRDIFPDWAVQTGVLKKGAAYYLFKAFEHLQYRVADTIGVETSHSFRYFEEGAFFDRVELLRNWTTTEAPKRIERIFRDELGLQDKVVFFFGGNMGVAQDMDNILRLAQRMITHPEAHFLLVGDGSERERLTKKVQGEKIQNVTILPPVDQATYMSMLSEFDVGMITLDRRIKTFSNTGKILGYTRCGLPILASYNSGNDLEELLHESQAGLGSVNGEDEHFYQNAVQLCDPDVRAKMGTNARVLLEKVFSVESIVKQITRRLERTK